MADKASQKKAERKQEDRQKGDCYAKSLRKRNGCKEEEVKVNVDCKAKDIARSTQEKNYKV